MTPRPSPHADAPTGEPLTGVWPAGGRAAGRALVAFGVIGVAATLALAVLTLLVAGPLALEAVAIEGQRESAIAALDSAAGALDAVATSAGDAGPSLAQSEASVRDAAAVTSQLADAAAGLAVFSSTFADTATRSRTLSGDLTRAADALALNETDAAAMAARLTALAVQVRGLRSALSAGPTPPGGFAGTEVGLVGLVALALVLLGWLATAAGTSLWLGRRMLRLAP